MTNKKMLKVLTKLGFVGTDVSLEESFKNGMVYSEKLGCVIFNYDNSTDFRVAYYVTADFIETVYKDKAAVVSIVVGSTNEDSIVSKLESWVACVGQSELNCETLERVELCNKLQKMVYWQNAVEITQFLESDARFENVSIEEETEYEVGVVMFDFNGKHHNLQFSGRNIKGGKIDGGMVRVLHKSKMFDVLKNIVGVVV